MPEPAYVFFTMDCEKPLPKPLPEFGTWGPADWAAARSSAAAFCDVLAEAGLVATMFVVPDAARTQADLWGDLAGRGCELGLHVHAQITGQTGRWSKFLGQYPPDVQKEIFAETIDLWSTALGRRPVVYRPGNFTGDASIFPTLLAAGLTAGSVALPGRRKPKYAADWADAPRTAAWRPAGEPPDRAFLDVPVTASAVPVPEGTDPVHLRVEEEITAGAVRRIVTETLAAHDPAGPLPATICVMTHNIVPFEDPAEADKLRSWIDAIRQAIAEEEYDFKNTTIQTFRQHCLAQGAPTDDPT